jgi:DNA-binding transcriptional ArsR family regulator
MTINQTFQALADPTRRKILELLKKGDKPVNEIANNFTVTLPTLSHHLTVLKAAGLVTAERQGQQVIYSLNLSVFEEVAKEIFNLFNNK